MDGLVLSYDALVQCLFHLEQATGLIAGKPGYRNAGPHIDHFGDVLLGNLHLLGSLLLFPIQERFAYPLFQLQLLITKLGGIFVLLICNCLVLIFAHRLEGFA
ncbi:MAG: hypothetical protein DDT25_00916 [Chloroflexi bacterium]|nr:hypothetical protein [Chloroflexota bacterium]